MKLKMNAAYLQRKFGDQITVKTDGRGIPLDKYWRLKLKDSKIDRCIEVLSKKEQISRSEREKTNKQIAEKG